MAQGPPANPELFCTVSQTSEKFVEGDSLAKTVLLYIVNSLKKLRRLTDLQQFFKGLVHFLDSDKINQQIEAE